MNAGATDYDDVYRSQPDELAFDVEDVEGRIPDGLRGTLVRNGPGLLEVGVDPINFFDGHGMLCGLGFRDGRARFRSRQVRSALFESEARAGRQLVRRPFTNLPGWWRNLFNPKFTGSASHDVCLWAGRLLATGETAHQALDPSTFAARGAERWGFSDEHVLCPMPRVDPVADRLVGYAVKPGITRPDEITFFEVDRGGSVVSRTSHRLDQSPAVVHDVAFTEGYYVVLELPMKIRPLTFLLGRRDVWNSLAWPAGRRPQAVLVPRPGGGARQPVAVELPGSATVTFHIANAYEEDGRVILDGPAAEGPFDFYSAAPPALRARDHLPRTLTPAGAMFRYRIDPAAGRAEVTRFLSAGEAPEVNPARHGRRHRFVYTMTPGDSDGGEPDPNMVLWYHAIAKLDVDAGTHASWDAGPGRFCSPPAFVSEPGATEEDHGWLLTWVLDARTHETDAVIHDARDLARGPLATLHLRRRLPAVSHGKFEPELELAPSTA